MTWMENFAHSMSRLTSEMNCGSRRRRYKREHRTMKVFREQPGIWTEICLVFKCYIFDEGLACLNQEKKYSNSSRFVINSHQHTLNHHLCHINKFCFAFPLPSFRQKGRNEANKKRKRRREKNTADRFRNAKQNFNSTINFSLLANKPLLIACS